MSAPAPALAGFQWVPSGETAAPADSVQTWPSAPVAPVTAAPAPDFSAAASSDPEVISPVIITGASSNAAPVPSSSPSSPVVSNEMPPVATGAEKNTGAPTALAAQSARPSKSSNGIVRGFAKNVPLAVALRQILPAGYGFSIDPDVDLGILVSFQGNKPWREVLAAALEPAGLVMHEQGQMVSISHGEGPAVISEKPHAPFPQLASAPHNLGPPPGVEPDLPPMTAPASAPATGAMQWQAERGDSLHKILESWCHRSNVELNWLAEYDYPLQASISFSGNFEDAVRMLLTGFENAHPQPVAELHNNARIGQKVLIVATRGNSYSD